MPSRRSANLATVSAGRRSPACAGRPRGRLPHRCPAAAVEPAGTSAYPYILGAALTVDADPAQTKNWEAKLDQIFATGSTDARFEVSWTLKHRYQAADLSRVAAFLDRPASENDTRVGAAMIILTTLARK